MLCTLSGQVPVEPVASLKSGHVFEKRLLLKYLEQNQQRCPATGEELDAEKDLLALQPPVAAAAAANGSNSTAAAAVAPEAASIPQLLALFQSEWDGVVLETFTLKKHLEKTRQELSHALYQHDAACRVIARLSAENAALRDKLSARASASAAGDVEMDGGDGAGLDAAALASVEAKQKALAKARKDFKKSAAPALAARLAGLGDWRQASSHTLHDSDKPGVLCVAVDAKQPARVATGGVDRRVQVFDTAAQQLVATLAGHAKRVSAVAFHASADLLVSASHDATVKLWRGTGAENTENTENTAISGTGAFALAHTLTGHAGAVAAASIHATGDFVLSAGADAHWALHELRGGRLLARRANGAQEALAAQFHPDGGIFATGGAASVQMWDVRSLANVASFAGAGAALSFSENGYQLASGGADGVVRLWDLRKLKSVSELAAGAAVRDVHFDASGAHLAVAAGDKALVLKEAGKTDWGVVRTFADHTAAVTGAKFAADSSFLASVSMDRTLKITR